ncbi:MAG: hypothetical protein QHJ73_07455 [Armatimonadota bacterium]|nr:hypothetical protein [Armatimonadota bacterium]
MNPPPRIWLFLLPLLAVGWFFSPLRLPRGEAASQSLPAPPPLERHLTTLRVRFGLKDSEPMDWSGGVTVTQARLLGVDGWHFGQGDWARQGRWKAQTRRYPARPGQNPANRPMGDVGVIVRLAGVGPDTRLEITTPRGAFTVAPADLSPAAPSLFLDGAAEVERIADTQQLIATTDEEDFPSAAVAPDGTVFVAYVAFTQGEHHLTRPVLTQEPKDFALFSEPVRGDRVWLLALKGSEWSRPVPLTAGGEDLYRTATAVDGNGRAWVFFSRHVGADREWTGGDWELFAASFRDGKTGPLLRLTQEPGADIYPAACTDAEGRVWVVWQGFRGADARILAARQEGDGFGRPFTVADTSANEWTPAIAATSGLPAVVTVAWDSYVQGSYDVFLRTWQGGKLGAVLPVAATPKCEARPTLAYDHGRRLWAAWEEGPEGWGKDFGALVPQQKRGAPLYSVRRVGVRVLQNDKWAEPARDVNALWPRRPIPPRRQMGPEPVRASFPRLGVDRQGKPWLSVRVWMAPNVLANQVWHEYVTFPTAGGWRTPLFVSGPHRMMDKRPAMVADPQGGLLLIGSGSGRQGLGPVVRQGPQIPIEERLPADPSNQNLYVVPLEASAAGGEPALNPVASPSVTAPAPTTENADVRRVRAYRSRLGGATLRVLRGEFHRHTELSSDGGGDGPLEDMWRYGLDVAAMEWIGNGDHDNGAREYPWWLIQKTTSIFQVEGVFTPMFTYERSVNYPDGHRNVVFARRGVRPLPRLQGGTGEIMDDVPLERRPNSPDTQMLYHYLLAFDGVCASHTSATDMGTDWRDTHRRAEPIVEIYQGDRNNYERAEAPRAATGPQDSIGGWRPQGFVNLALQRGARLGFQCSSDHISTHVSYCNVFAQEHTRRSILEAMKKRRVYGSTDNILADVRWTAGGAEHFMGEEFVGTKAPTVRVRLWGTAPFAKVVIVKNDRYVHSTAPGKTNVDFSWTDGDPTPGTSYYYVRGEQADGELVWVSPVWITLPRG